MSYYTRVLTANPHPPTVEQIVRAVKKDGYDVHIEADAPDAGWSEITLTHTNGQVIATIERNSVEEDSLGEGEMGEFNDELADVLPTTSAQWLREFFDHVRCIYAFRHLNGAQSEEGFAILQSARNAIWSSGEAIIQADGEGYTNSDGYHITWQFSDSVSGLWWMGLLKNDDWVHFQMDLGSQVHRRSFKNGEVPDGVTFV